MFSKLLKRDSYFNEHDRKQILLVFFKSCFCFFDEQVSNTQIFQIQFHTGFIAPGTNVLKFNK